MENVKVCSTPMSQSSKLEKDENGKDVDIKMFRSMIGSLLYLIASRPGIDFSICLCVRFQSCPKESHLIVVKRILRYLYGTSNFGLWYSKDDTFDLIGYSDSDFAGNRTNRKSTSGTCQFLGSTLVSLFSKKQISVALSTVEPKYITVGSCVA
ncbi:secreted RxLR effector protein 161-like [Jatropha curcas]|uniref:secreted RxLR effector protein 161-like n=1 Tax=Jatropha curcas TaxID=180498 RepID=UPI0018959D5C|nr:secreted RxLR effector protein 161-like [Jatropha curcas]